jgi:hypothetical protein
MVCQFRLRVADQISLAVLGLVRCADLTVAPKGAQFEIANADSRTVFLSANDTRRFHMTTNKPIELGRVSEETKETGPLTDDHPMSSKGPFTA